LVNIRLYNGLMGIEALVIMVLYNKFNMVLAAFITSALFRRNLLLIMMVNNDW
jgi:hypothetical protein